MIASFYPKLEKVTRTFANIQLRSTIDWPTLVDTKLLNKMWKRVLLEDFGAKTQMSKHAMIIKCDFAV